MKKKFKMSNLDCANCAAKMEALIKKIPGVVDASVSFMTQRLTLEAADDAFDEIVKLAADACAKIDADCTLILK
ncbi:MAG: cation transporter [Oscillospiraceae bacterium]|jgi:copper chaperone CopZ